MNKKYEYQLNKEIQQIENQIEDLETIYLKKTKGKGNLVTGYDHNSIANRADQLRTPPRRRVSVEKYERIFSLSSYTSKANKGINQKIFNNYNYQNNRPKHDDRSPDYPFSSYPARNYRYSFTRYDDNNERISSQERSQRSNQSIKSMRNYTPHKKQEQRYSSSEKK